METQQRHSLQRDHSASCLQRLRPAPVPTCRLRFSGYSRQGNKAPDDACDDDIRHLLSISTLFTNHILQTHGADIVNTSALLLWHLGVFHWDECRTTVLRNTPLDNKPHRLGEIAEWHQKRKRKAQRALESQQEENDSEMGKKRNRRKKKQAVRANETAFTTANHDGNGGGSNALDCNYPGGRSGIKPETTDGQTTHETNDGRDTLGHNPQLRGGAQQLPFNPSTLNNRHVDVDDPDTTLLDVSPLKVTQAYHDEAAEDSHPAGDDVPSKLYNINMFLASHKREIKVPHLKAKQLAALEPPLSERSLQDVYTDNPALKLAGLDADGTLQLAGHTAKHIALEATFAFLQACIPPADRDIFWAQMITATASKEGDAAPTATVAIPLGILDHPHHKSAARAPMHQLLANCIATLQSPFGTRDASSLAGVFGRCIALCDALADTKRAEGLHATLKALQWLVVGLAAKETQLYRQMNAVLMGDLDVRYPPGKGVSADRQKDERALLAAHRDEFEGLKAPFRAEFLMRLKALMSVKGVH